MPGGTKNILRQNIHKSLETFANVLHQEASSFCYTFVYMYFFIFIFQAAVSGSIFDRMETGRFFPLKVKELLLAFRNCAHLF